MTTNMPTDGSSRSMQVLRPKPGSGQTVAVAASASVGLTTPLASDTEVIRISPTTNITYTANGAATAAGDAFLAAGAFEFIAVRKGDAPEFRDTGVGGTVFVTEME